MKMAIGCRNEMFSQTIFTMTVSGTERISPTKPQSQPQSERLTRITKGEIPRFSPSIFGSKTFPMSMLTRRTDNVMNTMGKGDG